MDALTAVALIGALLVKHFICDYPFQLAYMLEGKGSYLNEGGIHHALIHGLGTGIVFAAFGLWSVAATLAVIDALAHYHIDYFKSKANKMSNLNPGKKWFWNALGLDQLAHQFTYLGLVALVLYK